MGHAGDRGRRESVPPHGEPLERGGGPHRGGFFSRQLGRPPGVGTAVEDRLDGIHEVVHPRVGQALAPGLVERKLPAQAEDVPGIDRGAAVHRPQQEVAGLVERRDGGRGVGRATGERRLRRHHAAGDPGEQPGRGRGHGDRQPLGRLLATEPRADGRQ
jgi:hypothetical protein